MSRYRQVPEWYYSIIFGQWSQLVAFYLIDRDIVSVTMFVFAVICIEVVHTDLPVWGKSSPQQLNLLIQS